VGGTVPRHSIRHSLNSGHERFVKKRVSFVDYDVSALA
jgi:hypothetical protein